MTHREVQELLAKLQEEIKEAKEHLKQAEQEGKKLDLALERAKAQIK